MKKIILSILIFQCSLLIAQAQWIQQTSGVTSPLYDIEFINKYTGWSCGEGGIILQTTNGGINWNTQITNVPNKPLFGIHPVNENVVYSVGWFGTILKNGVGVDGAATIHKTTNGGINWLSFSIAGAGDFYRVSFIDAYTGFTVADGTNNVYKTTNFGTNRSEIATVNDVAEGLYSIKFSSDSVGWIGGNFSRSYKSTNGGFN